MAVLYVSRGPVGEKDFELPFEGLGGDRHIAIYDPVIERTIDTVGNLVRRQPRLAHEHPEWLIVRSGSRDAHHYPLEERLLDDKTLRDFMDRSQIQALSILEPRYDEAAGRWSAPILRTPQGYPTHEYNISTKDLRQIEIEAILRHNEAIYEPRTSRSPKQEPVPEFHYELPNGDYHANRFIRLATALRDKIHVERIADWIFPDLTKDTLVLADTGPLLSLMLTLQVWARTRHDWSIDIDALRRYPASRNEIAMAAAEHLDVLFLISVNSSGKLVRMFDEWVKEVPREGANMRSLIVCDTPDTRSGVPQQLPESTTVLATVGVERYPIDPKRRRCHICDQSARIRLDDSTYERMTFARRVWTLSHDIGGKNKEFWEAVDRQDAAELHVTREVYRRDGRGPRHHAIHLNVIKLLQDEHFCKVVVDKIRESRMPDLVLVPVDDVGVPEKLAAIRSVTANALKWDACRAEQDIVPVHPGELTSEMKDRIRAVGQILIVDDIIVTGSTLHELRRRLYECFVSVPRSTTSSEDVVRLPQLSAVVMVARPSTSSVLRSLVRPFTGPGAGAQKTIDLRWASRCYLPDGDDCPWCHEQKDLAQYRHDVEGAARQYLDDRIEHLKNEPVRAPLPFSVPTHPNRHDRYTEGSFFGCLREVPAFAAVSSAAVELREEKMKLNSSATPMSVLDVSMVLSAYFDAVILSAIFRTLSPPELRDDERAEEIAREIATVGIASPGLIAELGLAALTGRLPRDPVYRRLSAAKQELAKRPPDERGEDLVALELLCRLLEPPT